ncbi:hypothetical protein F4808DRAFT_456213 [Astrocystis sublimbata]|nr:hypothetical protein F4808DRAFT_456213 [Astrocystis sublimbata]
MPVALIIGVGSKVGTASAEAFAAAGYEVAVASRTQRLDSTRFPFFEFDAAEPANVPKLFEGVHQSIGVPEVVIYNAFASASSSSSVLDIDSIEGHQRRMNVNAITPTIVADEAVKGFLELESQGKLGPHGATFLFTGNALNEKTVPGFFSLGTLLVSTMLTSVNEMVLRCTKGSMVVRTLKFSSNWLVDQDRALGIEHYYQNTESHRRSPNAGVFVQEYYDRKNGTGSFAASPPSNRSRFIEMVTHPDASRSSNPQANLERAGPSLAPHPDARGFPGTLVSSPARVGTRTRTRQISIQSLLDDNNEEAGSSNLYSNPPPTHRPSEIPASSAARRTPIPTRQSSADNESDLEEGEIRE